MSQKETWRTRKYWSEVGGLLIEEFPAVSGTKTTGRRTIDGVIVLNEEKGIHPGSFYDIQSKDVIIVQTKSGRLGMYLLGQAYFSRFLLEKYKPKSISCVAICGKYDDVMGELAKSQGIEVVVLEDNAYEQRYDSSLYLKKKTVLRHLSIKT